MARYTITLRETIDLGQEYVLFQFDKPQELQFEEGQYGVFLHVDKEIEGRKMRAFSFASSNLRSTLDIATKVVDEPSDFKQKMMELKPGDQMTVDGPMGRFIHDKDRPNVLIAGGIGITPIRSILQRFGGTTRFHLVYSEKNNHFPFQKELQDMPNVNDIYVSGIEPTEGAIEAAVNNHKNGATYYISGSPGFITGISAILEKLHVDSSNIIFDRFTGYSDSEV
jgi:ferredoxin-NADP reductase